MDQVDVLHCRIRLHEAAVVWFLTDHRDHQQTHGLGAHTGILVSHDGIQRSLTVGGCVEILHDGLGDLRIIHKIHIFNKFRKIVPQHLLEMSISLNLGNTDIGDELGGRVHVPHVADLECRVHLELANGFAVRGDDHVLSDQVQIYVRLYQTVVPEDLSRLVPLETALLVTSHDGVEEQDYDDQGDVVAEDVVDVVAQSPYLTYSDDRYEHDQAGYQNDDHGQSDDGQLV